MFPVYGRHKRTGKREQETRGDPIAVLPGAQCGGRGHSLHPHRRTKVCPGFALRSGRRHPPERGPARCTIDAWSVSAPTATRLWPPTPRPTGVPPAAAPSSRATPCPSRRTASHPPRSIIAASCSRAATPWAASSPRSSPTPGDAGADGTAARPSVDRTPGLALSLFWLICAAERRSPRPPSTLPWHWATGSESSPAGTPAR